MAEAEATIGQTTINQKASAIAEEMEVVAVAATAAAVAMAVVAAATATAAEGRGAMVGARAGKGGANRQQSIK